MHNNTAMDWLNYHHLYYFWTIAEVGTVSGAAKKLRLSQSTLSYQLKELESRLGHTLLIRGKRQVGLTEAGRFTLDYANTIFSTGSELLDALTNRAQLTQSRKLRIGAVSSLSKNLQIEFIRPFLNRSNTRITIVENSLPELISQLQNHALDILISNIPVVTGEATDIHNHTLADVPVVFVAKPPVKIPRKSFPFWLNGMDVVLPTRLSRARAEIDRILQTAKVTVNLRAEADDMALMRLLALQGSGFALVPEIVVQGELKNGQLLRVQRVPGLKETFYAITPSRKFENPLVSEAISDFRKRYKGVFSR